MLLSLGESVSTRVGISHQSRRLDRVTLVVRFDFEHQRGFDDDIRLITAIDDPIFVTGRRLSFAGNGPGGLRQRVARAGFIHALRQSWAELAMDPNSQTNDTPRKVIVGYDVHGKLSVLVSQWQSLLVST